MEPIRFGHTWWVNFWVRLPVLLALLAGAIVALIAYLRQRRRMASCLGAVGFALLLVMNLLATILPVLAARMEVHGRTVTQVVTTTGVLGFFLNLFSAAAFALLIVAVIVETRRAGGSE